MASLALAIPTAIFSHLKDAVLLPNSSSVVYLEDVDIYQPERNETQDETLVFVSKFCYPFPGKFGRSVYAQSVVLGRFLIQFLIPLLIIGTLYTITARSLMHRLVTFNIFWSTNVGAFICHYSYSAIGGFSTEKSHNSKFFITVCRYYFRF